MNDVPKVMRCSECRELFIFQTAANFKELLGTGPMSDILLCPVCRLKATQRGVQEPPGS
jgi:hypothetical protein